MATLAAKEVEKLARQYLNDTQGSEEWDPKADILTHINAGEDDIIKRRSDARYNSSGTLLTITPLTAISGDVNLDSTWLVALAHFIAWKCFSYDVDNSKKLARANGQRDRYLDAMGV